MKLIVDREKILPTLSLLNTVVEKRQTLPILFNLHFELADGKLTVVGTDLEVEITETIDGVKGDNGTFTVTAEKVHVLTRMLPEGAEITIKQDKDKAVLTSGRSRYSFKTLPATEFPRIETGNWEERFKINQRVLKSLLDKTSSSMAVQDVRYYLNGVLFKLSSKQLYAVATDGHRLAQSDVDIDVEFKEPRELIVPRKAVAEIDRFIGGGDADAEAADGDGDADKIEDAELTVEISNNHLKLSKPNTVLITSLIDGKFPEFKEVLEKKFDVVVNVDRNVFIDTLNRAAILSVDGSFRGVKLNLEKNMLRVTASNQEQEEAIEEIEVEYGGEPMDVGYNVNYLVDAARASDSDTIDVHLQGADGICVIKTPGDERTTWLIMPMRI